MRKITFLGYYGMRNYGDDLFSLVTRSAANSLCKNYEFEFMFVDDKFTKFSRLFPILLSGLNVLGSVLRLIAAFWGVWGASRVVFCGGSLFSDKTSRVMIVLAKFAIWRNIPISALGISVGPFLNSKKEYEIGRVLSRMDFVTLRDKSSFDYMVRMYPNVICHHLPDLAASCESFFPSRFDSPKVLALDQISVGFSACNFEPTDSAAKFVDVFIEAISKFELSRNLNVIILNLNSNPSGGDVDLNMYAFEQLSKSGVAVEYWDYSSKGVLETYKVFSSLDLYVGARLHGALTAFVRGTPFVLFEYHKKCTDFLDDICVSKGLRLDIGSLNSDHLVKVLSGLLIDSDRFNEAARKYSVKSVENYNLFFEKINREGV